VVSLTGVLEVKFKAKKPLRRSVLGAWLLGLLQVLLGVHHSLAFLCTLDRFALLIRQADYVNLHTEIVRVPGATIVHHSDMWVLTHKDLRLSARLRVLREIIAEEFDKIRHQLDTRP
jgi:hypothetical protein